jgi:hypothetical protein
VLGHGRSQKTTQEGAALVIWPMPVLHDAGVFAGIMRVIATLRDTWLGWAYLTKTVRKPQRGGVNFDAPMIFCACSIQNSPAASEMLQDEFGTK